MFHRFSKSYMQIEFHLQPVGLIICKVPKWKEAKRRVQTHKLTPWMRNKHKKLASKFHLLKLKNQKSQHHGLGLVWTKPTDLISALLSSLRSHLRLSMICALPILKKCTRPSPPFATFPGLHPPRPTACIFCALAEMKMKTNRPIHSLIKMIRLYLSNYD